MVVLIDLVCLRAYVDAEFVKHPAHHMTLLSCEVLLALYIPAPITGRCAKSFGMRLGPHGVHMHRLLVLPNTMKATKTAAAW